jgi:hypothetical protein
LSDLILGFFPCFPKSQGGQYQEIQAYCAD